MTIYEYNWYGDCQSDNFSLNFESKRKMFAVLFCCCARYMGGREGTRADRPKIHNAGERIIIRLNEEEESNKKRNGLEKRGVAGSGWKRQNNLESNDIVFGASSSADVTYQTSRRGETDLDMMRGIMSHGWRAHREANLVDADSRVIIRLENEERASTWAAHVTRPGAGDVYEDAEDEQEEETEDKEEETDEEVKIDYVRPEKAPEDEDEEEVEGNEYIDTDWDPSAIQDIFGPDVTTSGPGMTFNPGRH